MSFIDEPLLDRIWMVSRFKLSYEHIRIKSIMRARAILRDLYRRLGATHFLDMGKGNR